MRTGLLLLVAFLSGPPLGWSSAAPPKPAPPVRPATSAATAARPNVILMITDDQGYGDLACHGNPHLHTPNLDKLHAQSVRLTNFHVSPLCAPTRAALLTGRYSLRTGVWHVLSGHSLLRQGEVTMADVLRANGYRTGIFGKWHLGENYPFRPTDRGFDEAVVHGGGGIGTTPDYWGNDYFDDTYFRNGTPEKFPGYSTDVLFQEALRFIEANRERPFFCYLPTAAPHSPFNVAAKYSEPYKQKGLPSSVANFYGMITNVDENVGRLAAKLDEWNLSERTIVIFLTDNGSSTGSETFNAGMRGGKGRPYDGGHRVPCFLRWPGGRLKGGRDLDTLAAHIDLLPTLIELCGCAPPRGVRFDGASLVPLLTGNAHGWPERVLLVDNQAVERPVKWRRSCVMTQRWRLVDGAELYDIRNDPGQKHNVADQHVQTVEELRSHYERWWQEVGKGFDQVPHIIVGSGHENPSWLNPWDMHGQCVYMQYQVEQCERADGWWAVEVAAAGAYEIILRRWPPELKKSINDGLHQTRVRKAGQAPVEIKGASLARVTVAGLDLAQPFESDAEQVVVHARLPAGRTKLQAWFVNDSVLGGATWGAYYVGVKKK
jgi:arylsulfatase A-like enzyme